MHPLNQLAPEGVYVDDDGTVSIDLRRLFEEPVYQGWVDDMIPPGLHTITYLGETMTVEAREDGTLCCNGDVLAEVY